MRIAVNTRFLMSGKLEGFGVYTHEIMKRMVAQYAGDDFDFYFDRPYSREFIYGPNVTPHVVFPPARHPALFIAWFEFRLKHLIRKLGADVFFSPDSFIPLRLKVPTVITVHDVAYQRFPEHIGKSHLWYYRTYMPRFIEEATRILTVSEFSKNEICHFYNVDPSKVNVVYNGVSPEFRPVGEEVRNSIRARYSGGRPFFLYVGAIHPRKNVAATIRAFDHFKKYYGSDICFVIAGRNSWMFDDVKEAYENSAFKDDIIFPGFIPHHELPAVAGSAFALLNLSLYEGFGLPVAEAMACGVPVICSSAESTGAVLAEVGGDAVLTADPGSFESIADAMRTLVEGDVLRNRMIDKGLERACMFSWDDAAQRTRRILDSVV